MKKFMCLMLALSVVMMTMVIAPMSASAVSSFYVFDNFDNSTSVDTSKWEARYLSNTDRIKIVENSTFDADGTGNSLMMTGVTYNWFGTALDKAITSGILNINFDVWAPTGYSEEVKLLLYNEAGTSTQISTIKKNVYTGGMEQNNWNSWTIVGDLELGAWTNVDYRLNLDTDEVTFKVTQETGKSWTKSGKYIDKDGTNTATNLSNIKKIRFDGHNSTQKVYIDNLLVQNLVRELPVTDDFNGATIDTEKWNAITGSASQVSLDSGALKIYDIYDNAGIGTTVTEPITDGKINIKYDVWADTNFIERNSPRSELILYGGTGLGDSNAILFMSKDGFVCGKTFIRSIEKEKWYTVDVTLDAATQKADFVVTPRDGGASASQTVDTGKTTLASNSQISFGAKYLNYSPKSYALVDNVSISKTVNAPKSESVTFVKYDDTTSTALTNVSAGTKEIVVGFSADVDDSTLNDDTVTLVNKTTNTTVDYTGVYDATAKTWTIPVTNYLDPSTTYELTVTSAVQNGDGESAPLYRYAFTTDAGEYKVASLKAYKGDTVVTELSELATGDVVTIKANVINTTGANQDLLLVYAGYNGNELEYCDALSTRDILATEKNITVDTFTVTVNKANLTKIKLLGWSSYNAMDYLTTGDNIID